MSETWRAALWIGVPWVLTGLLACFLVGRRETRGIGYHFRITDLIAFAVFAVLGPIALGLYVVQD